MRLRYKPLADLNAHPYGDGQSDQHEENGERHQQPATQANVRVGILQCWGARWQKTNTFVGISQYTLNLTRIQTAVWRKTMFTQVWPRNFLPFIHLWTPAFCKWVWLVTHPHTHYFIALIRFSTRSTSSFLPAAFHSVTISYGQHAASQWMRSLPSRSCKFIGPTDRVISQDAIERLTVTLNNGYML